MTTLKLIAIAMLAAVLVGPWGMLSPFMPLGTRFVLLAVLLVGGVLWVSHSDDETQETDQESRQR